MQHSIWSEWEKGGECESGCLYGPSKRLSEGSTGLITYKRNCIHPSRRCSGNYSKYESCVAKQCYKVQFTTIDDFARDVCKRAQKFEADLTGEGHQIVGSVGKIVNKCMNELNLYIKFIKYAEDSCKVFCKTKTNGTSPRIWPFPDGTTCRAKDYDHNDIAYCISGHCKRFTCDNSSDNYYKINSIFCGNRDQNNESNNIENYSAENRRHSSIKKVPWRREYKEPKTTRERTRERPTGIYGPTTVRSKYENGSLLI